MSDKGITKNLCCMYIMTTLKCVAIIAAQCTRLSKFLIKSECHERLHYGMDISDLSCRNVMCCALVMSI